jgi:glycosyltransferase involved in cell wall biosynthesis
MTAEKGADLLYQVIPRIAAFADCVLLGAGSEGERFAALDNCEVIDDYELDGLPEQIAAVSPDLAMLLSVVPETFSYTLSEVWALGLPVVASNMGAFADRVTHGHNGWLVEPQVDAVVDSLAQLHADRSAIATVTQSVRSQPVVRATEMVAQYIELSPVAPAIPARRYHLPRRSFQNPYAQAGAGDTASLFLERTRGVEATYRSVLKEFLQYTEEKLVHTRRMPGMLRAVVSRLLRVVGRRL